MRVVASARCLTEGVDVPSVDGVLFADPRSSTIDVIQAVGRVLRPAPGKTLGTVIVPVELPDDGDDDTALSTSVWEPVWSVLRALRAHDPRMAEDLDRVSREQAVTGHTHGWRPGRIEFVLPDGVDPDPIVLRAVQEAGSAWEPFYAVLADWIATHPGIRVPWNLEWKARRVGWWAERQRVAYRRGVLPESRARRLDGLDGWAWDRKTGEWHDTAALVADHAAAHGRIVEDQHTSPWAGLKTRTRPAMHLGTWVALQRQAWRDGTLPDTQAAVLEQVPGWQWTVLPSDDTHMVDALRQYVEFEKHARPPADVVEDGLPLGRWVWDVRRRHLTATLHPALRDEITAATPSKWARGDAHWTWDEAETRWRLAYTALLRYRDREAHVNIPTGWQETVLGVTIGLYQWVALQRFLRRRSDLDPAHEAALTRIPGWVWDAQTRGADGTPIDLAGHPHGTAKGAAARCPCGPCRSYTRARSDDHLERLRTRQLGGPNAVPADPVRTHLTGLETALQQMHTDSASRNGRTSIADAAKVPLGVVRKVMGGATHISAAHATALLAVTLDDVLGQAHAVIGSRGRAVSRGGQKIPAEPTRAALARLATRGFGAQWVARELGYNRKVAVGGQTVTRRVAEQIADLEARTRGVHLPHPRTRTSPPPLAELLTGA